MGFIFGAPSEAGEVWAFAGGSDSADGLASGDGFDLADDADLAAPVADESIARSRVTSRGSLSSSIPLNAL